jgi:hypothetical protein
MWANLHKNSNKQQSGFLILVVKSSWILVYIMNIFFCIGYLPALIYDIAEIAKKSL